MARGNRKYEPWRTQEGLIQLEAWARNGLTLKQIAHNCNISERTLHNWRDCFPDIAEAIKKGAEVVDIEVENALKKAAVGYNYEEIERHVELIGGVERVKEKRTTKYMPPNVTAAIFWLKNRKRNVWQDRPEPDIESDEQVVIVDDIAKK